MSPLRPVYEGAPPEPPVRLVLDIARDDRGVIRVHVRRGEDGAVDYGVLTLEELWPLMDSLAPHDE